MLYLAKINDIIVRFKVDAIIPRSLLKQRMLSYDFWENGDYCSVSNGCFTVIPERSYDLSLKTDRGFTTMQNGVVYERIDDGSFMVIGHVNDLPQISPATINLDTLI